MSRPEPFGMTLVCFSTEMLIFSGSDGIGELLQTLTSSTEVSYV